MGAALAYYTMFSIAPLLLIVIYRRTRLRRRSAAKSSVSLKRAGRPRCARGAGLLESVRKPAESVTATVLGVVVLLDWRPPSL
jgi:uncharacterized BrkB/YihY/UPF0761 family membrane protein